MQALFLNVLEISLTGSLFAIAVMLVRLLCRKAPRWIFCVLWGLVALRLILPVSIESNLSIVPKSVASGQVISNIGERYIGSVDVYYKNNADYANALEAGCQPVYSNDGYYVVTDRGSLEAPATIGDTVFPILAWIWVAGMTAMIGYLLVSFHLLKRSMAEATLLRDNIWQCEQVDSPFVLGIIKPRIYLPYAITDADMANVIAHEQAHLHRRDHCWKPLGFLLLSVHWFNPLMWIAYILLCRDIEAACDERVIKNMEKDKMRAYSAALLHCSVCRSRIAACPLAFGELGVKERIRRVMNYKKPAFRIIITTAVICIVVAVCFLTDPVLPSFDAPPYNNFDSGPMKTIDGNLKTYHQNTDGTWQADGRHYQYRLEISGRMPNAAVDSTFVYLSNLKAISFDQAWKAAGLSSNLDDYFTAEEAILVEWLTGDRRKVWGWAQGLDQEEIISASPWRHDDEYRELEPLNDEEVLELVILLNKLTKASFTENKYLTGGTPTFGIEINAASETCHINESIAPNGALEVRYRGKMWWIDDEALLDFVQRVTGTERAE